MILKLLHVGVGVVNLENAILQYQSLGYVIDESFSMPEHSIKGAMLHSPNKGPMIELIECDDSTSELGKKAKNHLAFLTDDIDIDTTIMLKAGFTISYPKIVTPNEEFVYLEDINNNQVELVEYKKGEI